MARYFFNIHHHQELVDRGGASFSTAQAARQYALRYAGDLIRDMSQCDYQDDDWQMDVCDAEGSVLFSFMFFGLDGSISVASGRRLHRTFRTVPAHGC